MVPSALQEMFVDLLNELYNQEQQSLLVLPKLADAAYAQELDDALRAHLDETRRHVIRLEQIAGQRAIQLGAQETKGFKGAMDDCLTLTIDCLTEPHVRDAALVALAQYLEHYETAIQKQRASWATPSPKRRPLTCN